MDNPEPVDPRQVTEDRDVGDLARMDSELEKQLPVGADTRPLAEDGMFPETMGSTLREWQPSVISEE